MIRYFGERKKIFNVHFRNIRGGRDDFFESHLDNGSMKMVEVLKTLREVQYPCMVMPDHAPDHASDPRDEQCNAFAFGDIRALLQAVNDEPNGPA